MMCKIERSEKMMWSIFMKSNKINKSQQSFEFTYSIDIKPACVSVVAEPGLFDFMGEFFFF